MKAGRLGVILLVLGVVGVLLRLQGVPEVDPDVFHEMALAKAWRALGAFPHADVFAYTPTVSPVVHHEWGFGVLLDAVVRTMGLGGLVLIRAALWSGIMAMLVATLRRQKVALPLLATALLLTALPLAMGVSTVRALMVTLLMLSILTYFLHTDREDPSRGGWWVTLWLPMYVVWLNCHAGFVVGVGLVACEFAERTLRTRRIPWRLAGVLGAMAALVPLNPYGFDYFHYLARALTISRADITEWNPLWHKPEALALVALMTALAAYGVVRGKALAGVLVVIVATVLAVQHLRHAPLLAVLWLAYVPGWLAASPLAELLESLWRRWAIAAGAVAAALGLWAVLGSGGGDLYTARLRVLPNTDGGRPYAVFPVGAVNYLQTQGEGGFRGNVLAPFPVGGYVSWRLWPAAKVALDGRYEVAYEPAVARRIFEFYAARDNWREVLALYPPDLILVERGSPIEAKLRDADGRWVEEYGDGAYVVFGRP